MPKMRAHKAWQFLRTTGEPIFFDLTKVPISMCIWWVHIFVFSLKKPWKLTCPLKKVLEEDCAFLPWTFVNFRGQKQKPSRVSVWKWSERLLVSWFTIYLNLFRGLTTSRVRTCSFFQYQQDIPVGLKLISAGSREVWVAESWKTWIKCRISHQTSARWPNIFQAPKMEEPSPIAAWIGLM